MLRLVYAATVLSLGTVLFLALAVPRLYTGYSERAVWTELQQAVQGEPLDPKIMAALEDGDVALARQYVELAQELGRPIGGETRAALAEAEGTVATVLRNAGDFAGAYITGHADSAAGVAGAVISDLTVVGDVRDIISEGGKAAIGEDYSQFLLTLAAIGLAAEGVTIATGGTSLVVKAGISVLKVAKRTGNLTVALTQRLTRLARAAARRTSAADVARTAPGGSTGTATGAAAGLTRAAARAELRSTLAAVNTMAGNAGTADAVKLLRFARTTNEVRDLAAFTARFGRRSRAVVELTGKTALRAFRTSVRGLRILFAFLWGVLAWLAGLIGLGLFKRAVHWVLGLFRGAFLAVALP